jgi:hypothetical protein
MAEKLATLKRTRKRVATKKRVAVTSELPLKETLSTLQTIFPTFKTPISQILERVRTGSKYSSAIQISGDERPFAWSKNDPTVFPIVTFSKSGSALDALKVVAFWRTELAHADCIFLGAEIIPGSFFIKIYAKVKDKAGKAKDKTANAFNKIKNVASKSGPKFLKTFRGVAAYVLIGSSFFVPTAPPVHLPPDSHPSIVRMAEEKAKDWRNDLKLADLLSGTVLAAIDAKKKQQEKKEAERKKKEGGEKKD